MELYLEPKRPERNLVTGRFMKGHTPFLKGKKWKDLFSEETQARMLSGILAHRGKGGQKKKPVICIAKDGTWRKFDSAKEAGIALKVHSGTISNVCLGKRKTAGGYRWFYEESNEWLNLVKWGNV
jgi:hypothetical protein